MGRRAGLSALQNGDRDSGLFDAAQSAAILGERGPSSLDLTRSALPAQLAHEFEDLAEASRADRMSFRLKAAGGIEGYAPAEAGLPTLRCWTAIAEIEKPQHLALQNFAECGGVVTLDDIDLVRAEFQRPRRREATLCERRGR